jgi:dTDP-glucose 4,6-dehydratase
MSFPRLPSDDLAHVLEQTRELWAAARGWRIFLTGGTGFFGPWLAETFAHANETLGLDAELVVLTRDPHRTLQRLPHYGSLSGVSLHAGDVRGFERPKDRFDLVIHGAAESSQQTHVGDHRHMFETIVEGTRQTLGLARDNGAGRYLLLSSGAVYGRQPPDMLELSEEYSGGPDLGDARSAYAEGKRAAEVMAAIEGADGSLSVRVARCFAFVGPHLPLDIHFAVGNFILDAMKGGPIRIAGDGTAVRSYLYMSDLAIWLWTLALSPRATGAYNMGSRHALSILDLAREVVAGCAPSAGIHVTRKALPGEVPHRYVPSTQRAERDLGVRQRIPLRDAVRRTVAWYSQ